jgi:WD40 repeat protein
MISASDGLRVASTRQDGVVQLWEAVTGQVLSVLPTGTGDANIVAWSPDRSLHAVSTDEGIVELWDVAAPSAAAPTAPAGCRLAAPTFVAMR